MKQAFTIATLMFLIPMSASAALPIPEPDIMPLLAMGGVIGLAFYLRKRKK